MMRLPLKTLVVIPTYDEVDNVPRIVPAVLARGDAVDVLVVDDNSPDGTGDVAAGLAAENSRVHVLHRPGKQGLGRAYLAGFAWGLARPYDVIVEMDADFSHRPEDLDAILAAAEDADVVVGSRYVDGRVTVINWPIARLLISLFGSWYARTITRLKVRDATGGFNCWRREVLESIGLEHIESNGYAFQIELKYRASRKGFTIVEIPIVFSERDSGESKMSKAIVFEAVWRVWRLRALSLFGKLN